MSRFIAERYEVLEDLGSGRDGSVHLAFDRVRAERVAIKWARILAARQRGALQREYELGTLLTHPSWTRVLDHGRDGSIGYFTMEHVDGVPLARALSTLSAGEVLRLLFQACEALDGLHRLGVVHADLKPEHLVVTRGPEGVRLKILDLSLALAVPAARDGRQEIAAEHGPGLVRGTMAFASPAVVAGTPPEPRDDLFALGASFLAGRPAHSPGPDSPVRDSCAPNSADGELRAGTVLAEVLARLTSADPDTRYRSARHALGDMIRAWPQGAGPVPAEALHGPLLGRTETLLDFERDLGAFVSQPAARCTLLTGTPGAGKSRLLVEMQRRARLRDLSVVSIESLGASSWPGLLRELELAHARGLPELARALDAFESAGPEDVADLLRAAAAGRPLAVFLAPDLGRDDAADALVTELFASHPGCPLWLVATSGAAKPRRAMDGVRPIEVGPLSREDSLELSRTLLPLADEWVLEHLYAHGRGHAGFSEVAARAAACALARAELSPEALDRVIHAHLPSSLEAVLREQLESLPPAARALARELAVFRHPVPRTVLERCSTHTPDASNSLEDLVRAGLLARRETPTGPRLHFPDESLRRLLAADSDSRAWAERNRTACGAWQVEAPGRERAVALAHHAFEAGDAGLALEASAEAASLSIHADDPSAAAGLMLRCVEETGLDDARLGPVWERLGEAQFRLGQLEQADRTFARAAALAGDSDAFPMWARWGEVLDGMGEPERAREKLERALASPSSKAGDALARVCEILGRVEYRLGDADAARRTFERGLNALSDQAPGQPAASLWNDLGVLAFRASRLDEAEGHHRRALAIRQQLADEDGISRSLTNLGSVDMSRGLYRSAQQRFEESLAIKRRLGNQQLIALTLSNIALLDSWLGDYRASLERHEEALRIRREIGAASDQARSLTHLSSVWYEKSEFGRAHECATQALAIAERSGERDEGFVRALCALAEVTCAVGWSAAAQGAIDAGLAASEQLGYRLGLGILGSLRAEVLAQTAGEGSWPERVERETEAALQALRGTAEPRVLASALLRGSTLLLDTPGLAPRPEWIEEARAIAGRLEAAALVTRGELLLAHVELGDQLPNEASSRFFKVLDRARALGAPELQWRACAGLALFHARYGRPDRVALWLQRCLEVFREVIDRMPDPAMQASYLEVGPRRRVLERISQWTGVSTR